MSVNNHGLGRGLDSLFPTDFSPQSVTAARSEGVTQIKLTDIKAKKDQPRTKFYEETIEQLSYSIKTHGVLQPILLVEPVKGSYVILAGERRFRAAQIAGLKTIPAIVRTVGNLEQLEIALVENIQREDLSALDQALSIKRLRDDFGQDVATIAKKLGKAESTISNIMRLLKLTIEHQTALSDGRISEGHARALLAIAHDVKAQAQLYDHMINDGWTTQRSELFVKSHKLSGGLKEKQADLQRTENKQTETLQKRLSTPVRIQRTAKGGRLVIDFKTDDQLEIIFSKLGA